MLVRISWRNIWRNKVRSLVVILAIAIGLTGGVFLTGLMNGMVAQQTSSTINNQISEIQIHHPDFGDNMNPEYLIDHVEQKSQTIRQNDQVTEITYRSKSSAMASTATTGAGIVINGIIPEKEKKVTTIHENIIDGTYFENDAYSSPMVLGQKLAHKLRTEIGNKVVITLQSNTGEMASNLFRVVGIYKTNDTRFDEMQLFVNYSDLNDMLGISAGQANEIAIRTVSKEVAPEAAASLQDEFRDLKVQSWRELKPSLIVVMTMMDQFGYWLMVIILFALIFGIVNTMLMVILERKRELGMLMSVGMNKTRVFKMIMLETTMLSLVGGAIGLGISILLMGIFGNTGINFASWAEGLEAMGYSSFVYPYVTPGFYAGVTVLVIVTAIIASIWPTRKALKMNPADAVRSE
ncbi:MAG: ABC transporter permease [Bacteroidales bacterium]